MARSVARLKGDGIARNCHLNSGRFITGEMNKGKFMSLKAREFYSGSNGDRWFVLHELDSGTGFGQSWCAMRRTEQRFGGVRQRRGEDRCHIDLVDDSANHSKCDYDHH